MKKNLFKKSISIILLIAIGTSLFASTLLVPNKQKAEAAKTATVITPESQIKGYLKVKAVKRGSTDESDLELVQYKKLRTDAHPFNIKIICVYVDLADYWKNIFKFLPGVTPENVKEEITETSIDSGGHFIIPMNKDVKGWEAKLASIWIAAKPKDNYKPNYKSESSAFRMLNENYSSADSSQKPTCVVWPKDESLGGLAQSLREIAIKVMLTILFPQSIVTGELVDQLTPQLTTSSGNIYFTNAPFTLYPDPNLKNLKAVQATDEKINSGLQESWVEMIAKAAVDVYGPAFDWMVKKLQEVLSTALEWALKLVEEVVIIPSSQLNDAGVGVRNTWQFVVNTCNILFILGLLIIVFANVLRIQLDAYAIKTLLPRLIIAMIFINFSLLMCMAILDFSNLLSREIIMNVPQAMNAAQDYQKAFANLAPSGVGGIQTMIVPFFSAAGGTSYVITTLLAPAGLSVAGDIAIGIVIIGLILVLAGLIIGLLLAGMLVVRVLMIWFLAIISPLVFLFMVLPFTRGLSSRWWSEWVRWIFMGPVVVLILTIGIGMVSHMNPASANTLATGGNVEWLKPIFVVAMLFAALAVPSILGGQIMGFAKGLAGKAWGAAMATPMIATWRQRAKAIGFEKAGARWSAIGKALGNKEMEAMGEGAIGSASEAHNMRTMGDQELAELSNSTGNAAVKEAARRELLGRGLSTDFYEKNKILPQSNREKQLAFARAPLLAENTAKGIYDRLARGEAIDPVNIRSSDLSDDRFGGALQMALESGDSTLQQRARSIVAQGLSTDAGREALLSNNVLKNMVTDEKLLGRPVQERLVQAALTSYNKQHFTAFSGKFSQQKMNDIVSSLGRNRDNISGWNTEIIDDKTFGGRKRFKDLLPGQNKTLL